MAALLPAIQAADPVTLKDRQRAAVCSPATPARRKAVAAYRSRAHHIFPGRSAQIFVTPTCFCSARPLHRKTRWCASSSQRRAPRLPCAAPPPTACWLCSAAATPSPPLHASGRAPPTTKKPKPDARIPCAPRQYAPPAIPSQSPPAALNRAAPRSPCPPRPQRPVRGADLQDDGQGPAGCAPRLPRCSGVPQRCAAAAAAGVSLWPRRLRRVPQARGGAGACGAAPGRGGAAAPRANASAPPSGLGGAGGWVGGRIAEARES